MKSKYLIIGLLFILTILASQQALGVSPTDYVSYYNFGKEGIQAVGTGTIYATSSQAYGTWEFDINLASTSLSSNIFINSHISDYTGTIGDRYSVTTLSGILYLVRKDDGSSNANILIQSPSSYVDLNTRYTIKVTRNSFVDEFVTGAVGTFAMYIKGGSYGDTYTLVTAGPVGSNPVTDNNHITSNYYVSDLRSNDKISNVVIGSSSLDADDFTSGTGTFINFLVDISRSYDGSITGMTFNTTFPNYNISGSGTPYSGEFDGTNDVVVISDIPTTSWTSMSVCAWAKNDVAEENRIIYFNDGTDTEFGFLGFNGADDKIRMTIFDGSVGTIYSDNAITDNAFHHYCGVQDNGTLKLYVDGELQTDTASVNIFFTSDLDFFIADDNVQNGVNNFDGLIDDVIIYDNALNTTEVESLYNYGFTTPIVSTVNDSTESTAVVKQVGSTSFSGGSPTTIFSSDFNVSRNNTPLYGGYTFQVASNGANTMFCELLIDGVSKTNVTRTQYAGESAGNVYISFPTEFIDEGTHTQELECSRSSGVGLITISNAIGVGHFLVDQSGTVLNYNSSTISKTVTSGSSYTLLDSINISIGNKTNTSSINPRKNHIVIDGAFTYTNNGVSSETPEMYASVNGTNCTFLPRTTSAGGVASVSYDCIVFNVTENELYQIDFYGNGTNVLYEGDVTVKNFFLSTNEIIGGSGILTGANFSGNTYTTLISGVDGGNNNHDLADVFNKLSFAITTDTNTEVSIYFNISNGSEYLTTVWERNFIAGQTGVMIGQDVIQNLPKDDYLVSLHANCGTVGATCTISGGQTSGYLTNVITTVTNSFDVTAYNNWTNDSIINFTVTDGSSVTSVNGTATFFTTNDFENLTISSTGYFDKVVLNHNTSNDLNVSLFESDIKFLGYELSTDNLLSGVNFTIDGITKNENESFYLASGSYNVTAQKSGYYDLTTEVTINSLDNKTINIEGLYNSIINITAYEVVTNQSISDFNGWLYDFNTLVNTTFNSTGSYAEVPAIRNNSYQVFIFKEGNYSGATESFTALDNATTNLNLGLYVWNSVYIQFKDADTLALIDDRSISLELISDTYSNNYSTSNGTLYVTLLQPETYIARYDTTGYSERFNNFVLTNGSSLNKTFYFQNNSVNVTIGVFDETRNFLAGVTVISQKFNVATNSYITQEVTETDAEGLTVQKLTLADEFYKFFVRDSEGDILPVIISGETRTSTPPAYIYSTTVSIQVQTATVVSNYTEVYEDFQVVTFELNNFTNNIKLEYSDASSLAEQVCLTTYIQSANGRTEYARDCEVSSNVGTILQSIIDPDQTTYYSKVTVIRASDSKEIFITDQLFVPEGFNYGVSGMVMQLLLTTTILGVSAISLPLSVIFIPLSLFFGYALSWHDLGLSTYSIITITGVIIAFIISRYRR